MLINKIIRTAIGADYADQQHPSDSRRGRFIAPTADLSAIFGYSAIRPIGRGTSRLYCWAFSIFQLLTEQLI